jgi:hypothetical protein
MMASQRGPTCHSFAAIECTPSQKDYAAIPFEPNVKITLTFIIHES